ncbi:MAG TPA: (2Fe-2S) ferredoxin domain-containing protein [Thermotogota bacterium]|nr:(2Fe-2S) ferredoxin domain-containing protein [Thermotogota bacterium]HPJ88309.1 (2Fe-2S) ferredoxin domain-containing protein [Thermotogota bacterium]HPR95344.1 (2Fe-2S) ferredoxin domain-containing protein [Thermotogota bacterium]
MKDIYVCMGSACYLKGSSQVVDTLKKEIERENLEARIHLKGSFCIGPCNKGVVIKIDDEVFCQFSPENVVSRFHKEIIPYINSLEE